MFLKQEWKLRIMEIISSQKNRSICFLEAVSTAKPTCTVFIQGRQ